METQFSLDELGLTLDGLWDEREGETVLTLTAHGVYASAFIELRAEATAAGGVDTGWRVVVTEPNGRECYKAAASGFGDIIEHAKRLLAEMDEYAGAQAGDE